MTETYPAKTVAYKLVEWADRDGVKDFTALKLHKMLFFIEGLYMLDHNLPLLDEEFEAWEYGPIIPTLFKEFVIHGSEPIKLDRPYKAKAIKISDLAYLEKAWNELKDLRSFTYSKLLHLKISPWKKNFRVDGEVIPKYKIVEYMRNLLVDQEPLVQTNL